MKGGDELTERQEDERTQGCVWVMRQMTVKMRDQDEPTEMKEEERSRVSVWVMRQVTVRMRVQDRLTERTGDEGIRGQCGNDNETRSRGVEGHEWVIAELEEEIGKKT
jgi:hypothetical protein